jgi:hypothetical protein
MTKSFIARKTIESKLGPIWDLRLKNRVFKSKNVFLAKASF